MPHAPPYVTYPMVWNMPANEITDPELIISDYGTSFVISQTPSLTLHTPALYSPPEVFFNEPILYPLFKTFAWGPDDIIAEMVNTWGQPPVKWWNFWANDSKFFNPDGSWIINFPHISTPVFRHLHEHMWDMG
ncbi:hypothetical protein EMCG_04991 [[Emmonsia] crescens]|uniref:Uncharacterized protein n=1 Tax=[Emmonsia] crescens TaxID=73230 RepID=A0A0G2HRF6_9EURO|nr:hypothetical protein EMCG_04991 [Emmonsia crescens UAMH 3008]